MSKAGHHYRRKEDTEVLLNRSVTCTTSYEGIHNWPEAPDEVAFLRNPHRHIFEVVVEITVDHDDRDIEFIMMKHQVDRWLSKHQDQNGVWEMGRQSCEDVAVKLLQYLHEVYPHRWISVSVYEDGENGCTVSNIVR